MYAKQDNPEPHNNTGVELDELYVELFQPVDPGLLRSIG